MARDMLYLVLNGRNNSWEDTCFIIDFDIDSIYIYTRTYGLNNFVIPHR